MKVPTQKNEKCEFTLDDGQICVVTLTKDGTFYGEAEEFDFVAANVEELRAKLTKWGAR